MTAWKEGIPDEFGFDRYGESPYYDVPDGWAILVEYDWAGGYEFDQVVVWQNVATGELRAAYDAGCSCPSPFGDLDLADAKLIREVDDLRSVIDRADESYNDTDPKLWDRQDEGVAKIKAAVHRALREASRAYAQSDECRAKFDAAKKIINAPPLELRITAGDAEMVVSWAEWALTQAPSNSVLRAATERFREAFNDAAREANRRA